MLERKAGTFYYVRCLRTVVSAALVCLLFVAAFAPLANGQACTSGPNLILNPGFEDDLPEDFEDLDAWDPWVVTFSDFFPICADGINCTAIDPYVPNSGVGWIGFGPGFELQTSTVGQTFSTGPDTVVATLRFQMRSVAGTPPEPGDPLILDTMRVLIDGTPVQTFTEVTTTEGDYTERIINFVLAPGSHTLVFEYTVLDETDFEAAFNIDDIILNTCVATAATASVSGRVIASNGRGLANASVNLTDQLGVTRTTRTNSFGFYRFDDIRVGPSYVLQPISSRYTFSSQVITPVDDMSGVNFVAGQ